MAIIYSIDWRVGRYEVGGLVLDNSYGSYSDYYSC